MGFAPERVNTVTVDSYSTIVDVTAAQRALDAYVPQPMPVSRVWRSRSLAYTFVANQIDAYQSFYEMNRDALQYALAAFDVDVSPEERDEILSVYHELDVFADVRAAIRDLRDAGYPCFVLSNGNPEMLEAMVEHAGIDDLIVDTISAAEVQTFKPAAELYRHGAARTGTGINHIAHVTAGWFDVLGAQHAGMQGVWVNRKDDPWDPVAGTPDLTVTGLEELTTVLTA